MPTLKQLCGLSAAFIAFSTASFADCKPPIFSSLQLTTELHQAIADKQPEVVREVLNLGANPDWASSISGGSGLTTTRTPLLEAIYRAQASIVFDLLNANADPNHSFWDGDAEQDSLTPLGLAINTGDEASVRFLSTYGADPAVVRCGDTQTALNYAARLVHPEIVAFLMKGSSDPTALLAAVSAMRSETDPRPEVAFKTAQVEVLRRLTQQDFDPDGLQAHAAILLAVQAGRVDLVQVLLEAGVSPDVTDTNSRLEPTLLLLSALGGDPFMTNALLQGGADVNALDALENSALMYAAAGGSAEILRDLASRGVPLDANSFGQTALFLATRPEVVTALTELGLDPDTKDTLGRTALRVAVNPAPILSHPEAPVSDDPVSIARALLEAGSDPAIVDAQGHTPLMAVARGRHQARREMASLLIAGGAPIGGTDSQGNGVLHHFADTGDLEIVSELVAKGAVPSAADAKGQTAVHRMLLSAEIEPEVLAALVAEALLLGLPVDLADHEGLSPLHLVARHFQDEPGQYLALALLGAGADPNRLSRADTSPAMEAVNSDNGAVLTVIGEADGTQIDLLSSAGINALGLAAEAGNVAMVEQLLNLGATQDVANPQGDTALHLALIADREEVALLMIARGGAALQAPNARGKTPLMLAAQENLGEASIALLEGGANVCRADHEGNRAIDHALRPGVLSSQNLSVRTLEEYIAAVRQYRRALAEHYERLSRRLDRFNRGRRPVSPDVPRDGLMRSEIESKYRGTISPGGVFDPGAAFGEPTPSLFSRSEYTRAMAVCVISVFDLQNNSDEEREIQCIAEFIRSNHVAEAERRIKQNSPITWRALWALDTAFLEIGLIARDKLPPLPFSNAPLPADYPTESDLQDAIRVAHPEGLWGTCDGQPLYLSAALYGNVPVLDQWYGREMPLTLRDKNGRTAAILAQENGHLDAVRAIEANADATLERRGAELSADGFILAITNAGHDPETAALFVESSVDKNAPAGTGLRPLMQAVRGGAATLPIVQSLLMRGVGLEQTDGDRATALHHAASTGNLDAGKLLHLYGADINARDMEGETPRDKAVQNSHGTFVAWLDSL
ncbi:ankyrin repeat domain-containing protein [Roseibium algicola]|uniref:ankyrin repeat domain-containing protein n=1 Tax=Roseibium algicola TaxID=2857014 RepID=UPI0034578EA8